MLPRSATKSTPQPLGVLGELVHVDDVRERAELVEQGSVWPRWSRSGNE